MNSVLGAVQGGQKAVVIAEAGVNHNGNPELAHRLVDAAAQAGADIVKFQTFTVERLVSDDAPTTPYQQATGALNQSDLLRSLALPSSVWPELKRHADERGIGFLSTPFDTQSAELLVDLVDAIKVPSGELTHLDYIRTLAEMGKPLLISTGMGSMAEVEAAVLAAEFAPGTALFHCLSAYPAPAEESNLRAIPAMSESLGIPVGWSDHTLGSDAAVVAVALGARLFEKHLTLDRQMSGPDHLASLEPDQMALYVNSVRSAVSMLGDGVKRPMPSEAENARLVRRSWHAARDLHPGHVVAPGDVVALRPETGLRADTSPLGCKVVGTLMAGEPVAQSDLEWSK